MVKSSTVILVKCPGCGKCSKLQGGNKLQVTGKNAYLSIPCGCCRKKGLKLISQEKKN